MACRDPDGNLISVDSADMLSEHNLESVPGEKVPQFCLHFHINAFLCCHN